MNSTAQTILSQIGGGRFIAMTGAKSFGDHGDALSFRLPSNFATKGINYVKITLDADDTYSVTFGKVRGLKYTVISTFSMIYCDMLTELFERETGLATSLGRSVRVA